MHVLVDVPIKRRQIELNLYQATAIPFIYKELVCRLDVPFHTIVTINDKVYVIDGSQAHSCSFDKELCFFSEYASEHSYSTECVTALIAGVTIEHLFKVCDFKCTNDTRLKITELGANSYSILNPKNSLYLNCHDGDIWTTEPVYKTVLPKLGDTPGAWNIKLPCSCRILSSKSVEVLQPQFLCQKHDGFVTPAVHLTLPFHWTNLTDQVLQATTSKDIFRTGDMERIYSSHHEVIDWVKLNETTEAYQPYDFTDVQRTIHDHILTWHNFYSDGLMVIWNVIISVLVFHLFCRSHYSNYNIPVMYEFLRRAHGIHALEIEEISKRHLLFLIIIALVNLFIIWCFLLVLFFYCRRKWKRDSGIGCAFYTGREGRSRAGDSDTYMPLRAMGPDAAAPQQQPPQPGHSASYPPLPPYSTLPPLNNVR